jgi:8-oxo-dGTP pyrophosphatase MutT (NUDIX family)
MINRFQKELKNYHNLGFLNPHNLSDKEASLLPIKYGTRTVIITDDNKVVLIKVKGINAHTLVGGGIEDGMIRECMEESGYDVSIISRLGYIELWRKKYKRFIFGFLVKAKGNPSALKLTEDEIELGHEVCKYQVEKALKILERDIKNSNNNLASVRSLMFLKEAQKYIKNVVK